MVLEIDHLLDELEEIVYVCDPDTYDVLYINQNGRKALELGEGYQGGKCYKLLQGLDHPCDFCTNQYLSRDSFYIWEHTNPSLNRHYLLKDKLILWRGKTARMEFAIDITEKENTSRAVKSKLDVERALVECTRILMDENSLDKAISMVLESVGNFYKANRAYIFELHPKENLVKNTFEWCAENVPPQKEVLQNLTMQDVDYWLHAFTKDDLIFIEDLEKVKEVRREEYNILHAQGISSLLAVPLRIDGKITGFIGVDDPCQFQNDTSLLDSLSYFVTAETKKRSMEKQLQFMSYYDALTGVYNRNKYIQYLEQFGSKKLTSVGVVFADINGLKSFNDTYGHSQGDALITSVSCVLGNAFAGCDLYRVGGDEFVIVCENISRDDFEARANQAREMFSRNGSNSVSVGSTWADTGIDVRLLASKADLLMYQNKQSYYHGLLQVSSGLDGSSPRTGKAALESCYRMVLEQAGCGVFEWDCLRDSPGLPLCEEAGGNLYLSQNLAKNFGYSFIELNFLSFLLSENKIFSEDLPAFTDFVYEKNGTSTRELTCRLTTDQQRYEWYRLTIAMAVYPEGNRLHVVGTVRNVDQSALSQEQEKLLAGRDTLTGARSKESFYAEAERLLKEYPDRKYVVILMDIDKFKVVNDMYGMDGGNRVLVYIAELIRQSIMEQGIFARMYADVFYIMAECPMDRDAVHLVESISDGLETFGLETTLVPSFGICRVTDRKTPVVSLCEMAGFAHEAIKTQRNTRWMFYNDTMRRHVVEEKQLESEMEYALQNGQFQVYLQPKYDLEKGKVVGAEALVRWIHPTRGVIPPNSFIPLFEKNGFIIKLDEYIWRETCHILRAWIDCGLEPIPVSVNVSRLHLKSSSFDKVVSGLLRQYELPFDLLELELTESLFVENLDKKIKILLELRRKGFQLNMDDFGSGYSSLNMLKDIPIDTLKIDCGFFGETVTSSSGKIVIKHTIAMAHELDIQVVAEGVETKDQADFLVRSGCSVIQGYYFSRPIPALEFTEKYMQQ